MSLVTTHILDTTAGRPAVGVGGPARNRRGRTRRRRADRRRRPDPRPGPDTLEPGVYRLVFDTGAHLGPDSFFPEVTLTFRIADGTEHHHVPLLLSPFAYSTYRGS